MVRLPSGAQVSDSTDDLAIRAEASDLETCAAQLAHEMRNPLHAIMGFAKLIGDADRMQHRPDLLVSYAQTIDRIAGDMHDSVGDLIGVFARNPLRPPEAARTVALDQLVETVTSDLEHELAARGISLVARLAVDTAVARPRSLRRALRCLISNAARYGPPNSSVEVYSRQEPAEVAIGIRDFGPGMTEAEAREALRPFTRLSTEPQTDGSRSAGLGLPVARVIAEQHGGRLEMETCPGAGTTVWLRLPLSDPASPHDD